MIIDHYGVTTPHIILAHHSLSSDSSSARPAASRPAPQALGLLLLFPLPVICRAALVLSRLAVAFLRLVAAVLQRPGLALRGHLQHEVAHRAEHITARAPCRHCVATAPSASPLAPCTLLGTYCVRAALYLLEGARKRGPYILARLEAGSRLSSLLELHLDLHVGHCRPF